MRGLLDIAPRTVTVDVGDVKVGVCGVSVRGVAGLLARFPALQTLLSGREVTPDKLAEIAPDAVAAIIAAGTGYPGNPEAEKIADELPIDAQAELLSAILKVTMPKGVGPFVEKLQGLGAVLNLDPGPKAPDTKSRKPAKA